MHTQNFNHISLHDYLDALMADKETECVEFKHGKGGFPTKSFWESYSSFANTEGGVIIIGVKEKDGNFYTEGLSSEVVEKYEKDFWDTVNNTNKVSRVLLSNNDVVKGDYNGNYFIMFFVRRAVREERPVYVGVNPMRGTYRRNASGDYLCKEWEVAIMLSEQRPQLAQDFEVQEGFTLDDIDYESFKAFRRLFVALKPSHAWADEDDLTLLKHLKAYRKDRITGKEGLTLSGLLMFGKIDSITEAIPQYMIDYREYTPDSERWSDRIYSDGTWEANLFQAYRRILPRLQSFLPAPFKMNGNSRVDETNAHKALREAFVNLCVHASYQSDARLTILKYPTEIIFSNPGTMLVSKEQYYSGGESICRNPSLQTMFSLIGAAEKAGSGSDTIFHGWKEANFRLPVITEKAEPNKVELLLPLESILSEQTKRRLTELFGVKALNLETNKLKILSMALSMNCISNAILQHTIDLHPSDITALLKSLCRGYYLLPHGVGRGTVYVINRHYNKDAGETVFDTVDDNVAAGCLDDCAGLFDIDNQCPATMDRPIRQDSRLGVQANASGNISGNIAGNVTGNVIGNVLGNASCGTQKRLPYRDLAMKIVAAAATWKSVQEIARIVCYSAGHIRIRILPRMISDGLLEQLYKDMPTHSGQKYKATTKGRKFGKGMLANVKM